MRFRITILILILSAACRAQTTAEHARLYESGNKAAAYNMALELLKTDSTRSYASLALARHFIANNQWDTAVQYFKQAIAWDENKSWISGWSHALLGKCYIDSGFKVQGLQQLHDAVNLSATFNSVDFAIHILDSLTRSSGGGITDQLPAWVAIEGAHVSYRFQDTVGWSHLAALFIAAHERAYERIDSTFHAVLAKKVVMFVWKDRLQAQRLLGRPLGFANPTAYSCNVHLFQTTGHELTHILSYWGWGEEPVAGTRFIDEGVAVAFDCSSRDRYEVARRAIKGKGFHSVLYVWENDKALGEDVVYPVGGAFLYYCYLHSSADEFRHLIKNQTIKAARKLYGRERFEKMVLEFDGIVGFGG